jgi:hypothetical protein
MGETIQVHGSLAGRGAGFPICEAPASLQRYDATLIKCVHPVYTQAFVWYCRPSQCSVPTLLN